MRGFVVLSVLLSWCISHALAAGATYYVSVEGDDRNDGQSSETAFRTIARAAALMEAGDTCEIASGTYRETVRPTHSGTADAPIRFRAAREARVVVSGTEPVTGFEKQADSTYAADFVPFKSDINGADQVFSQQRPLTLARWPNASGDLSRPNKARFERFISKTRDSNQNLTTGELEDDDLPSSLDPVGARIYVQPNSSAWSWTFSGTVTARDGKRLTFISPNDSGKDGGKGYDPHSRYYLFDKRELLDAPGEYWIDRVAGRIYVRPLEADEPPAEIEAKQRDFGFDLTGVSHVHVTGIELFACSITTDRASGGDGIGYDEQNRPRYPWRGKESGIAESSGVVIDGITARYVSHFDDVSGHFFLQHGQSTGIVLSGTGHVVQNSVIQYSAGNGITMLGRGNRATNNLIADVAYRSTDAAGINTGGAAVTEDHEIDHNTILRCGRSGITPRGLVNSDPAQSRARIHHNRIAFCMLQDWDGGGIYAAVGDGGFLRIDHNEISHISGYTAAGIYPDYLRNWVIHHNLVHNVEWAILVQGDDTTSGDKTAACNMLISNNTLVVRNTSGAPHGPFGIAWGRGSKRGSVVMNNLIYCDNPTAGYAAMERRPDEVVFAGNVIATPGRNEPEVATDPKFAAPKQGDFTLQPGSPAIDAGLPLEPVTRDGVAVLPPELTINGNSPDAGAFESGVEPWQAGSTLPQAKNALREALDGPPPEVR